MNQWSRFWRGMRWGVAVAAAMYGCAESPESPEGTAPTDTDPDISEVADTSEAADTSEVGDDLGAFAPSDTPGQPDADSGQTDTPDSVDVSEDTDAERPAPPEPTVHFGRLAVGPEDVGVVVNLDDPLSPSIAEAYLEARGIPAANLVELSLGTAGNLAPRDFEARFAELEAALPAEVQVLALTSMQPFRVGCMGATAAFALGFDEKYCQTEPGCQTTAAIDYHQSDSTRPFDDHGVRPAMILSATTLEDAEALIERGVASGATFPQGVGWFLRTTDVARSVRWSDFLATVEAFDRPDALSLEYVDNSAGRAFNAVEGEADILFYFTGLAQVPSIDTNTYLPGAVADHLTSFGGSLPTSGQMSAIEWIRAGATGSYGTAIEPCNYTTKFPRTSVFVRHYFRGETLVEAYWKSVMTPGEGNFVGEPLARPFGPPQWTWSDGTLTIDTTHLVPNTTYTLESAESEDGPWTPTADRISVDAYRRETLTFGEIWAPHYRLVPAQSARTP